MADDFDHLIRTLRRLDIVGTLASFTPSPRPRRKLRSRSAVRIPDRPRAPVLPTLEHALRRRGQVRWFYHCTRCGVQWTGRIRQTKQHTASTLATLAVIRVPCPVCWALAWSEGDQATRDAWTAVPAWLRPRAR